MAVGKPAAPNAIKAPMAADCFEYLVFVNAGIDSAATGPQSSGTGDAVAVAVTDYCSHSMMVDNVWTRYLVGRMAQRFCLTALLGTTIEDSV